MEETDYQGRQSMSSVCTRYGIALAIPRVAQTPELDQCSSWSAFTLYHSLKNDYPVSTYIISVYMTAAVKLSTSFLSIILHRSRFPSCDYRFIPLTLWNAVELQPFDLHLTVCWHSIYHLYLLILQLPLSQWCSQNPNNMRIFHPQNAMKIWNFIPC